MIRRFLRNGALARNLALFLMTGLGGVLAAQEPARNQDDCLLRIRRISGEFRLDGIPDEAFWSLADSTASFWLKSPRLEVRADPATVVRMAFDEDHLYIAAWCEERSPVNVQTLRRDVDYFKGDGLGVILDPVNQHTYGYFFGASPFGTQMDGLLLGVGQDVQTTWDGTFHTATRRGDKGWTLEMVIPLRTLRFREGQTEWGLQIVRNVFNRNETQTWAPVPLQFDATDLNFTGRLIWSEPPGARVTNISVVPYVLAGTQKEAGAEPPVDNRLNAGIDARIGLGTALNLDLTLNPDFSQVDIDEQPVNLTRFNILLPERRTFFLENTDVFSNFGIDPVRPFFSRRIGLDSRGRSVPILYGARLSGNLSRDTRIGLLNMQTAATSGADAQNYTAASVRQQVLSRSTVSALITNRQSFREGSFEDSDYGRTAGMEANFRTESGTVEAWGGMHASFKPGVTGDMLTWSTGGGYYKGRFNGFIDYSGTGRNFYADMGFVQRVENYDAVRDTVIRQGYQWIFSKMSWTTFPETAGAWFNRHWLEVENSVVLNPDGSLNEATHGLVYNWFFADRRFIQAWADLNRVHLPFTTSFVPEGEPLPPGAYTYFQGGIFVDTDSRRPWYFLVGASGGQFYNGRIGSAQAGVTYRRMPYGSLGLRLNANHLDFPEPYGQADILNATLRLEFTFTRNLFWTSFVQLNTQREVLNMNSRFQWRFAPLSDLFLVYTDSYATIAGFGDRVRTLVLKVNYWWTI